MCNKGGEEEYKDFHFTSEWGGGKVSTAVKHRSSREGRKKESRKKGVVEQIMLRN